jgi:hypothetical protein
LIIINKHRIDGPVFEGLGGYKVWFLDGERMDCKSNEEFLKIVKYKWLL